MLLKVGVAMILLSLTLAAGVAVAVVGFQSSETPEAATVSSVKSPQASETPGKKKEFNPGQKLEIDRSGEEPAPEKPAPQNPASEKPAPQNPAPEPQSEPTSLPTDIPDWPRPSDEELAAADQPRYFNPEPGTEMSLTVEALGLYDVPVISSDSLDALDSSLMHLPETSFPWDGGAQRNVYIAGHYLGWPETASRLVFYNLDKLRKGDEAVLKDSLGRVYRYRVSESFMADPDESWVMGQELNRDMLTLQTCIPPNFEERLVVQADRV